MIALHLLIYKTGIHYLIKNIKQITIEKTISFDEDVDKDGLLGILNHILQKETYDEIHAYSAFPIFGLTPSSITQHHLAEDIIALNSKINSEDHEIMLNINLKHKLQFYFGFDKALYHRIKEKSNASKFYFSGEKFLQELKFNKGKKSQIHINLYHNQVEFWVFKNNEVLLYNLLDESSEVDFLYFILFSISKLPIDLPSTEIYLYGDCDSNDTFISELKKYAKNCKINQQNQHLKQHILLHHV